MAKQTSPRSPSGARRSGDDYQDLAALDLLIEMLEHPDRYAWIRVEAPDAGALDDVMALRAMDDKIIARQIKYSVASRIEGDEWTWEKLIEPESNGTTSLIEKWMKALAKVNGLGTIGYVGVHTNREFDDPIRSILHGSLIDYERIPVEIRERLDKLAGTAETCKEFFGIFHFDVDQPELEMREAQLLERFEVLGGDKAGFQNLQHDLRGWIRSRYEPSPDGCIRLRDIRKSSNWRVLKPLAENFAIPDDYVPPEMNLLEGDILSSGEGNACILLTGSPGVGKSTYLSYLTNELKAQDMPVVRHHYFLSNVDRSSAERLSHRRVAEGILQQIQECYPESVPTRASRNSSPNDLGAWLQESGNFYFERGKYLTIILDGLDHVWRDLNSLEELNALLGDILPLPRGVLFIMGTQKLDAERTPARMRALPESTYRELLPLNEERVKIWLERISPPFAHLQPYFAEKAIRAFYEKTKGHPLIMNYAAKYLQDLGLPIDEDSIETIPWTSPSEVRTYYQNLLSGISEAGRSILFLLAATEVPWPLEGVLGIVGGSRHEAHSRFKEVEFLLYRYPFGFSAFHNSLIAYLKDLNDYAVYAKDMLRKSVEWLRSCDEPFYKWAYLALLEHKLGDSTRLLSEVNRDWAINSIALGYPTEYALNVLKQSCQATFASGDWPSSLRRSSLLNYFEVATDPDYEFRRPLLYPQLRLFANRRDSFYLLEELRSGFASLPTAELAILLRYCRSQSLVELTAEVVDELAGRMYVLATREEDTISEWKKSIPPLMEALAFAGSGYEAFAIKVIETQKTKDRHRETLRSYLNTAFDVHDFALVQRISRELLDTDLRDECTEYVAKSALIDNLSLPTSLYEHLDVTNPLLAVYEKARGNDRLAYPGSGFGDSTILDLGWAAQYQHEDEIELFFERCFWGFVANDLWNLGSLSDEWLDEIDEDKWQHLLLRRLREIGEETALLVGSGRPIPFNFIYDSLSEFRPPSLHRSRDDYNYLFRAKRSILSIALLLRTISPNGPGGSIIGESIGDLHRNPFFDLWEALRALRHGATANHDILIQLVEVGRNEAGAIIEQLNEKGEKYGLLAECMATIGLSDEALSTLHSAAGCFMGYGWHKDMSLGYTLAAIELIIPVDRAKARELLVSILPATLHISDFTDGDETRHFKFETANLLAKHFPDLCYRYYLNLQKREEYYDAEETLHALLGHGDFGDPIFTAIATTAHDDKSLQIIADRSKTNAAALPVLASHLELHGVIPPKKERREQQSNSIEVAQREIPDHSKYRPEQLSEYIKALSDSGRYSAGEYVETWLNHWCNIDPENALHAAEQLLEHSPGSRVWLSVFTAHKTYRGTDSAFHFLHEGFRKESHWDHYMDYIQRARHFWSAVNTYYPNRWKEFFEKSFGSWKDLSLPSNGIFLNHTPRAVEFLIMFEDCESATALAEASAAVVRELISPLEFPDTK